MMRMTARLRLESAARYYVKGDATKLDELERAAVAFQNVLQIEVTAVNVPIADIDDKFDLGGEG